METVTPKSTKWLILLAAVLGGFVLPLSLYGYVAHSFWSNQPQLSRNFIAEMNAPIAKIPEEQRAWPHYRAALLKLKPGLERWKPEEFSPDSPSWPQIVSFVTGNQAALADLRQAAKLPHLGHLYSDEIQLEDQELFATGPNSVATGPKPPSENPVLLDVNLAPQQCLRAAIPLLIADARRTAALGDGVVAVANIAAVVGMVRHIQEPPNTATLGASWAAFTPCCEAIGEILVSHPHAFNEAQLFEIAEYLQDFSAKRVTLDFTFERAMMADIEQRRFTDDGQGDGYLFPQFEDEQPINPITKALLPLAQESWKRKTVSRKEYREKVAKLFKLAEQDCALPLWELQESSLTRELERLTEPGSFLISLFFPDLVQVSALGQVAAMQADATRVAVVLQLYRLRTGNWPESLDRLAPTFLAEIPTDRYDGHPLRYKLVDGAPCIYSVYLDKVDDGGKSAPESDPNATIVETLDPELATVGDLILWPALKSKPILDAEPNDDWEAEGLINPANQSEKL